MKINKKSVEAIKTLMAVTRKEEGDPREIEEIVQWLRDDITAEEYFGNNKIGLQDFQNNLNRYYVEQENFRKMQRR